MEQNIHLPALTVANACKTALLEINHQHTLDQKSYWWTFTGPKKTAAKEKQEDFLSALRDVALKKPADEMVLILPETHEYLKPHIKWLSEDVNV